MGDVNKLSTSSEFPISDVSTDLNASSSNNESSSTGQDSTTALAANPTPNPPELKNVQDLTRYV